MAWLDIILVQVISWLDIILLFMLLLGFFMHKLWLFPLHKKRPGEIHPGFGISTLGYIWLTVMGIGILVLIGQMILDL